MADAVELKASTHMRENTTSDGIEVAFGKEDPDNPQDGWSARKRWTVLSLALFVTFLSTYNSSANGSVGKQVEKEFGVKSSVFQVSSFAYQLMLGVGPLLLAPLSETFGRKMMLIILSGIITLLFLPQALAPNFASIAATRFFQGACGSVEGPVVAGIVADLFAKKDRGRPMAVFVCAVYGGNAFGPTISNWISFKLHWTWVYWVQMAASGLCFLLCLFFLPETRGELILAKRAAALTKETGKPHYIRGTDRADRAESWLSAVKITSTRPLVYLFTEPIVLACASWIGIAWGVVFLFIGAVAHVFTETYGFNQGQASSVLMTGFIGALLGFVSNELVQERIYQRAVVKGGGRAVPEVRLYSSAIGGIMFAVGCFGFAWTARPWLHWIAPAIFLTLANWGLWTIYLATYNYLADVYNIYSSSAQAAQSLLRGIMGACFPFFGIIMYDKLTYKWASTLVGSNLYFLPLRSHDRIIAMNVP